jgi:hypothetical protein
MRTIPLWVSLFALAGCGLVGDGQVYFQRSARLCEVGTLGQALNSTGPVPEGGGGGGECGGGEEFPEGGGQGALAPPTPTARAAFAV